MDKLIIGLVGEKLAGKDETAKYIIKKHGAFHIKFSNLLDEILGILDLPKTRRNEIDLGLGLRQVFGPEVLYHALKQRVLQASEDVVIINGVRMDEFDKIIKDLSAHMVYITAPLEVRYDRYKQRHEKADDGQMSLEEFSKQDREEETEKGIPNLGKKAKYHIDNTGTLEELYSKVEEVIKELLIPNV